MAKKSATITVNRSAEDGRFVTAAYAARNPRTTETENYKKSASVKSPK